MFRLRNPSPRSPYPSLQAQQTRRTSLPQLHPFHSRKAPLVSSTLFSQPVTTKTTPPTRATPSPAQPLTDLVYPSLGLAQSFKAHRLLRLFHQMIHSRHSVMQSLQRKASQRSRFSRLGL
ncbi:hypothetical protein BDV93DRAFT_151356 [Ceratobasidium sp. AG-I]|nr:hypothetical protein BDV93DRAFT_151356 [Ceratobasidium sp. AG-I]